MNKLLIALLVVSTNAFADMELQNYHHQLEMERLMRQQIQVMQQQQQDLEYQRRQAEYQRSAEAYQRSRDSYGSTKYQPMPAQNDGTDALCKNIPTLSGC